MQRGYENTWPLYPRLIVSRAGGTLTLVAATMRVTQSNDNCVSGATTLDECEEGEDAEDGGWRWGRQEKKVLGETVLLIEERMSR